MDNVKQTYSAIYISGVNHSLLIVRRSKTDYLTDFWTVEQQKGKKIEMSQHFVYCIFESSPAFPILFIKQLHGTHIF